MFAESFPSLLEVIVWWHLESLLLRLSLVLTIESFRGLRKVERTLQV